MTTRCTLCLGHGAYYVCDRYRIDCDDAYPCQRQCPCARTGVPLGDDDYHDWALDPPSP